MTIQTLIGIDVAKDELVVYRQDLVAQETLENRRLILKKWLRGLPAHCAIAVEATGEESGTGARNRGRVLKGIAARRITLPDRLFISSSLKIEGILEGLHRGFYATVNWRFTKHVKFLKNP